MKKKSKKKKSAPSPTTTEVYYVYIRGNCLEVKAFTFTSIFYV